MKSLDNGPAVIFECAGGRIDIPIGRWVAPHRAEDTPFVLSERQCEWIHRYRGHAWISRANREAFWQCMRCGWKPWPVYRASKNGAVNEDDSVWTFFSKLHAETREMLVTLSRAIECDVQRGKRKVRYEAARQAAGDSPIDAAGLRSMVISHHRR